MRDQSKECCCQPMLDEFQKSKFSLYHEEPADFCRSQWQRGQRSYIWLIYRWCLAAFFAGGWLGSVIETFNHGKWFIYLTDWGFTLVTYACIFGAVITTIYFNNPNYFKPGSCCLKIYWASHFTATVLALVITFVYWTTIHPNIEDEVDLYNIWEHALNSVFMFIDFFLVAFPTHIMHFVFPICVGLIYALFSLIYYFAGGLDIFGEHYIYFILDWERPGLAIGSLCIVYVLLLIFCVVVFWMYRLRLWIFRRHMKPQTREIIQRPAPNTV
ncbi:protein rolling stone-like [Drosophila sulfurigaster albostrigata]|uniref:protein rolling stone-like n=1 Tax=Drosophila sulfurigaster albostrigata TaxID=89887 RepID=UPI002D21D6D4|nr:protein rolling stone-like [Drosophila sulfurigaster albostrigata]